MLYTYLEGHQHQLAAAVVEVAADAHEELVEDNGATAVGIEVREHGFHLRGSPTQRVLRDQFLKLGQREVAAVVVVGDAEFAADAGDARGAAGLK